MKNNMLLHLQPPSQVFLTPIIDKIFQITLRFNEYL